MATKKTKKPLAEETGVYIYLGPSRRGLIQHAQIFSGDRTTILQALAPAMDQIPEIGDLVVEAGQAARTRQQIKDRRGAAWQAYKRIMSK